MRYLTIEQRESLRDALTSRAALLRAEIASNLRHNRQSRCAHLVPQSEDGRDLALEALAGLEKEINGVDIEQEMAQLRKVRDTLARLRSPQYGICDECAGDIAFTQLRENPYTTLCLACQQRRDLAPFVPQDR